ncbi:MAG: transcriptional repressor LexA [Alphaproteobacteria bacterium]|jgi:repressor LexA|nr:transcriptional repressor LexA [Alphaproteobacteria bacterium]MDP6602891.1 transcriptional repressor LexA [Rhodospirillales bacterium]
MLTRKQHELLMYIHECMQDMGVPPSYDEMKDALDLKSKSGIHRLITGLEERGFIKRLPHRARALEILRLPENVEPRALPSRGGFAPRVVGNDTGGIPGARPLGQGEIVQLPFYNRIAAGQPIAAVPDETNHFDVPAAMLGGGDHYALEVEGDSMIEAGILDGDVVLVERCETAENGTVVVALVDEEEVTLKRLRRKGDSIALEPANKEYETRIFGPDRVKVQGKLVGLIRRY